MFEVFVSKIELDEIGSYESFGIRAALDNDVIEISDVSVSKERILLFVEKLNRFDASPIHLYDFIQDAIGIEL